MGKGPTIGCSENNAVMVVSALFSIVTSLRFATCLSHHFHGLRVPRSGMAVL
jgi:hypothetical protein